MGRINCCKDCQERHDLCHASCEKYIKARKELDEFNEQERQRKMAHMAVMRPYVTEFLKMKLRNRPRHR